MLSRIKKGLTGRTFYDEFELIVSGIVLFLVSAVIVYTTILTSIELFRDFLLGMRFMDAEVFKETFGWLDPDHLDPLGIQPLNHIRLAAASRIDTSQHHRTDHNHGHSPKTYFIGLRVGHPGDVARTWRSRTLPRGTLLAHCWCRAEEALQSPGALNLAQHRRQRSQRRAGCAAPEDARQPRARPRFRKGRAWRARSRSRPLTARETVLHSRKTSPIIED
jgi:hypothetical protein